MKIAAGAILVVLATLPTASVGNADYLLEHSVGLNLNTPGLGVRYLFSKAYAAEVRGQYESDVLVAGLRGYRYFLLTPRAPIFLGVETDYVRYKGAHALGTGVATELFLGGEVFAFRRFSVQVDFGPSFVYLSEKKHRVTQSGFDYVVNLGLNYYLGGREETPQASEHASPAPAAAVHPTPMSAQAPVAPGAVPPSFDGDAAIPSPTATSPGAASTMLQSDPLYEKALGFYKAGNVDAALGAALDITRDDPQSTKAWSLVASCLLKKGDARGAAEAVDRSLNVIPNSVQPSPASTGVPTPAQPGVK